MHSLSAPFPGEAGATDAGSSPTLAAAVSEHQAPVGADAGLLPKTPPIRSIKTKSPLQTEEMLTVRIYNP